MRKVLGQSLILVLMAGLVGCESVEEPRRAASEAAAARGVPEAPGPPEPEYRLSADQTHSEFSRTVPPVVRVPSGAVIEAHTEEATDGQLSPDSRAEELADLDFGPIHPLTGPVYVEGADVGDVLAVTLHDVELGDWGWTAIMPGFGFLSEEFPDPALKTFELGADAESLRFSESISIPLRPFPGVMGVAPDTDDSLSTIPPRTNGGNMDNNDLTAGTTVYFPVLVEGALFSIGDAHAVQGDGEVCGTAVEAPTRIVYSVEVLEEWRSISEPQYENDEIYGVTAFAETLDEAAKKATRFMIDYLAEEHGLSRSDAYMLASLAADLEISEVVDVPHVLVNMKVPKSIFEGPSPTP